MLFINTCEKIQENISNQEKQHRSLLRGMWGMSSKAHVVSSSIQAKILPNQIQGNTCGIFSLGEEGNSLGKLMHDKNYSNLSSKPNYLSIVWQGFLFCY